MPAGKPWAPVRGKRIRLTRLTTTAAPDAGAAASGVSKGFITVKVTPQYDDGEAVRQKTADGDLCINEPGQVVLQNIAVEVQFCGVDPDLASLITGQPVVLDGTGAAVGLRLAGGVPITGGFALETWSGVAGNQAAWGYFLLPYLYGGKLSEFTIENGAANFTVTTESREGSAWGTGPYNVVDTAAIAPAVPGKLLTAIGAKDHVHLQYTTIAPPEPTNGLVAIPA